MWGGGGCGGGSVRYTPAVAKLHSRPVRAPHSSCIVVTRHDEPRRRAQHAEYLLVPGHAVAGVGGQPEVRYYYSYSTATIPKLPSNRTELNSTDTRHLFGAHLARCSDCCLDTRRLNRRSASLPGHALQLCKSGPALEPPPSRQVHVGVRGRSHRGGDGPSPVIPKQRNAKIQLTCCKPASRWAVTGSRTPRQQGHVHEDAACPSRWPADVQCLSPLFLRHDCLANRPSW